MLCVIYICYVLFILWNKMQNCCIYVLYVSATVTEHLNVEINDTDIFSCIFTMFA